MFKKFTIKTTIIISIIVGLLLTIYAGFISKHYIIKNQEKKLNIYKIIELYVTRFIHYSTVFITFFYPFLTTASILNDIIYIIMYIILYIHWIIFSECILSIKEKLILDPNYIVGSNVYYEPFVVLIYDSTIYYKINNCLAFICMFVVVRRIIIKLI